MTVAGPRQESCRKLDALTNRVARQVSDTCRRQLLWQMIVGLVVGRHVHLSKIVRAVGRGFANVHVTRK